MGLDGPPAKFHFARFQAAYTVVGNNDVLLASGTGDVATEDGNTAIWYDADIYKSVLPSVSSFLVRPCWRMDCTYLYLSLTERFSLQRVITNSEY